jgi:SlyX protein
MTTVDERITELEIKLAYAEDLLDQLNLTVFRQQQRIDLLQDEMRLLNDRLASVSARETEPPQQEIPPHY